MLSDGLKLLFGDMLTPMLDGEDIDEKETPILKLLEKKGTHGRPRAAARFIMLLHESENPLLLDRTTSAETLTKWIDECVKASRDEIEREKCDAEKGRNSLEESIPTWLSAWVYLIKEFDKGKDTEVKTTRYNRVPDHLVGTGVALIHCDSSFLPGSVGVGAGKDDLKKAQAQIAASKAAALAQSAQEASTATGKTREHLEPKGKRFRAQSEGADFERKNSVQAMEKLVSLKAEKAVTDQGTAEINMLNQQLITYTTALSNPNLPDAVKQNFVVMLTQTQIQLQAAQSRLYGGHSASGINNFTTPPRPGPSSSASSGGASTSPCPSMAPLSPGDGFLPWP